MNMMTPTMLSLVSGAILVFGVTAQSRLREQLLDEARTRLVTWYTDPSKVTSPNVKDGVSVRLLNDDLMCGGERWPVVYAEFDIDGVAPVYVFNAAADMSKQTSWNPQVTSMQSMGEHPHEGAVAWAMIFTLPLLGDRGFLQWEVADANFDAEEFWLVFSTHNNGQLQPISPIQGTTAAQNFGGYHITKTPTGSHVVLTQQVNLHFWVPFPLHELLHFFPPAWDATVGFVKKFAAQARMLSATPCAKNQTVLPPFVFQKSPAPLVPASTRLWEEGERVPALVQQAKWSGFGFLLVTSFGVTLFIVGWRRGCRGDKDYGPGRKRSSWNIYTSRGLNSQDEDYRHDLDEARQDSSLLDQSDGELKEFTV